MIPLTFGNPYNVSKRNAGIHLHLFQGIVITLKHASMSAPRRGKKLAHNDIQSLDTLNEKYHERSADHTN